MPRLQLAPACLIAWFVAFAAAVDCAAGTLEVSVTDERGQPVPRVAVHATRLQAGGDQVGALAPPSRAAVIDQHDNQFMPHVLVVQTGTEVAFPNSDVVSHHVYSFSPAKSFELGLYKGTVHPPLVFDEPGVVVLGCNIHDGMLGYVLVVPTPHFALTDARGVAVVTGLPAGEYSVEAWTPRARPAGLPSAKRLSVAAEARATLGVQLTGKLAPAHEHGATSLSWDRY
jgi:plastocyanin